MKPTGDTSREDRGYDIDSNREANVVTVNQALSRINMAFEPHVGKDNIDQVVGEKEEEIAGQVVNNPGKACTVYLIVGTRSVATDTLEAAVQTSSLDDTVIIGQEKDQQVTQAAIKTIAANRGGHATNRGVSSSTQAAGALNAPGKTGDRVKFMSNQLLKL